MKIKLLLGLITVIITMSRAQTIEPKYRILYDPVFWRSQLKLTNVQCEKINDINRDFYIVLVDTCKATTNASQRIEISHRLLTVRSVSIWNVLSPRQRSRLRKSFSKVDLSIYYQKQPRWYSLDCVARRLNSPMLT